MSTPAQEGERQSQLLASREPLAAVALTIVGAVALAGVGKVLLDGPRMGYATAMAVEGGSFVGLASVLVALVAVASCSVARPVTRHARPLAWTGAIVIAAAAIVSLVNLVGSLFATGNGPLVSALAAVGGGADALLRVLAVVVLVQLARRREKAPAPTGLPPEVAVAEAAPALPVAEPPSWARDESVGVAWASAKDAASDGGDAHGAWVGPATAAGADGAATPGAAAKADASLWETNQKSGES